MPTPSFPVRANESFEQEYPGSERLATEAVLNLLVATYYLEPFMSRWLRQHNLSLNGFNILEVLRGAGEPLPPHVISETILATRSTITTLLDTLERQGFVRRVPHPSDRRMLLIEISEKALGLLDRFLPVFHREERLWMAGLTADEKETLIVLLGKVQRHLRDLSAPGVSPAEALDPDQIPGRMPLSEKP